MSYVHEEKKIGPYTVKVVQDDEYREPFDCDLPDTFGIDMSNHRDYGTPTYGECMPVHMVDFMEWSSGEKGDDAFNCYRFLNDYHVLPVYLYDHSGRTVSTTPFSCGWDSGQAGVVYIGKREFAASGIYGVKKSWPSLKRNELAEKYLKSMVKELDDHMTGNIWGYTITDSDDEFVDSCWGFVGDPEYCMEQATSEATSLLTYARGKRIRKLKVLIKQHVPLLDRLPIVGARI